MRKTAGSQSPVILSRRRRIPERCSRRRQSPVILSHRRRIPERCSRRRQSPVILSHRRRISERCSRRRQSPVILSHRRRISERRCVVPFRDPSAHSTPLRFEKRKIARFPRVPSLLRMTRFSGAPGTSPRTGTKKGSSFCGGSPLHRSLSFFDQLFEELDRFDVAARFRILRRKRVHRHLAGRPIP